MNDKQISVLLQQDPQAGLNDLITQYRGLVKKICSGLLAGHNEDIEEVIADTFISIWKNASRFDSNRGSYKALISITARHNAINRWRQLQRTDMPMEDLDYINSGSREDILGNLLLQEDSQVLQELINELKEPDREIFIRRHYLLEPVTEIAGHLGMAEKQISNRLYQSKLRLREALKERGIAK